MIIDREDPRFWDMRTRERRLRRGEVTPREIQQFLDSLPDAAGKATASTPLEEPDERAHERRRAASGVRATMPPQSDDQLDDLDDLDDDEDEDDEDEEDEEDDKELK